MVSQAPKLPSGIAFEAPHTCRFAWGILPVPDSGHTSPGSSSFPPGCHCTIRALSTCAMHTGNQKGLLLGLAEGNMLYEHIVTYHQTNDMNRQNMQAASILFLPPRPSLVGGLMAHCARGKGGGGRSSCPTLGRRSWPNAQHFMVAATLR